MFSEHRARRIQRCTVAGSPLEPPVPAQARFQLLNLNINNNSTSKNDYNKTVLFCLELA